MILKTDNAEILTQSNKQLDWLQALRGVAAFMVVFAHAREYLHGTQWEQLVEQLLRPGAMGVDLFFIISGFIMVLTTADADGSFNYSFRFIKKRIARVWPLYAMATIFWAIFVVWLTRFYAQAPETLSDNLQSISKSLVFYPVNFSHPLYYDIALPVGWTLNFEMFFYLVFAVSMLFGRLRWVAFFAWMGIGLIAIPLWKGLSISEVQAVTDLHPQYLV